MPRVSRAAAARHREEAIVAASRLFLEHGVAGVSLQTVSQEVGLTHGFFYKQFASKSELVESAVARAFSDLLEQIAVSPVPEVLELCIAAGQRPNSSADCPITAFAANAYHAQADPTLRQAFAAGLARVLESTGAEDRFLVTLAACVGAAVIARAAGGEAFAAQIVAAVRAEPWNR
ncbi:MAG TPA: TetR/AcrR family transcriptional regulator [Actinoplanes sp.]|jgi:TetR/AcrR family transcriptional repressor of nem operon